LHFTFFVTGKCNARCRFCFYRAGETAEKPSKQKPEIALSEIEKVSASMGDLLWLSFSGGEVFLREDLPQIARVFYKNNRPAIILVSTNGLMPQVIEEKTEDILKSCPGSVVVLKLSLDGPEEIHDRMRGVDGAFRKVMQTYHGLSGLFPRYSNFEMGFNTVFCPENAGYIPGVVELVKNLSGSRTHTVSLIRGERLEKSPAEADYGKYREVCGLLASGLREKSLNTYSFRGGRLKAAQDIIQRELICRTGMEKKRLLPCLAGRINLVMTETEAGDIYPCESMTPGMRLGSARDFGFDLKRLLRSGRAREVVNRINRECFCTHECFMMTNVLFNIKTYPAILKEYLKVI
jgi:MoaA/NifB/PqqE/SkfB family radical SAM enzyme